MEKSRNYKKTTERTWGSGLEFDLWWKAIALDERTPPPSKTQRYNYCLTKSAFTAAFALQHGMNPETKEAPPHLCSSTNAQSDACIKMSKTRTIKLSQTNITQWNSRYRHSFDETCLQWCSNRDFCSTVLNQKLKTTLLWTFKPL